MSKSITLTPQLQQAFRLLQLPAPALQSRIQHALENNVMLEADEEFDATWALDTQADADAPWPHTAEGKVKRPAESAATLHEHLARQLEQAPLPNGPCAIGRALIGAINDDGYLAESLPAIAAAVAGRVRTDTGVVESVLAIIQQFDPVGVGARSVSECIGLQLAQLEPGTPGLDAAQRIARHHLQLADNQQLVDLQRLTGCSGTDVETALALIRSCERRPGAAFQSQPGTYVVPDVFVRHAADGWTVELNPVATPRLRLNERYAAMVTRSPDHALLRAQLQEARWLVGSLEIRNDTVLSVARAIVYRQKGFLDRSADALRSIPPGEIAEAVGMQESVIPRAAAGKYLHTPRGVFEFRFFLSAPAPRASGVAA
jgi:RNA polymerase sigma-54 factor